MFQLMGCLGAVAGVVLVAAWGYELAGAPGSVAGGVLGAFLGSLAGVGIVAAAFGVCILGERLSKHRHMSATFGKYWRRERAGAWTEAKERLLPGSTVAGSVVFAPYYGCFVDIGCGFPALLGRSADLDDTVHPHVPVGTRVEALVLEFHDRGREVALTRHDRHWVVFEGTPVAYLLGSHRPRAGEVRHAVPVTNGAARRLAVALEHEGCVRCETRGPGQDAVLVEISRRTRHAFVLDVFVSANA